MTSFPHRETIDFNRTSNVSANNEIIGSDFDTIDGDPSLSSKEIFEVERIEMLAPQNADGSLQTFDRLRLHDGADYYPFVNYRSFMLGWRGVNNRITTPRLGQPVLENKVSPEQRPLLTACPKFGPEDRVDVSVQNDGSQIDDNFTVRVTGWRFKGTDEEMRRYFSRASNLSETINQTISMSNPFDEEGNTYPNETIRILQAAEGGAHGQFARLTGGVNQNLPKVWPWATWADNAVATTANRDYEFSFADDNVDNKYQSVFLNFADGDDAAVFDYLMVDDGVANLDEMKMELESRDEEDIPQFNVQDTDEHELPFVRRLDGTYPSAEQYETSVAGSISRPVTKVDGVPTRISDSLQPAETVVWNDEGGIVAVDDGNSIPANGVLIGVQGNRLELTG